LIFNKYIFYQVFISKNYNADDEEIFVIFKMLKALKQIIKSELEL